MLEELRALGLPMGSWYEPVETVRQLEPDTEPEEVTLQTFVGWTTDQAKAEAAHELGAEIRPYRSSEPRFSGWEVVARVEVSQILNGQR